MARDLTSPARQSAYELGCMLRACGMTAQRDLCDHAPLLAAIALKLGPILPPTDEALDFGKAVEPLVYNTDQPETFAALWAVLLSDALQDGIVLDLMDPDLAALPDLTRCLGQARRSTILRAAQVYLNRRKKEDTLGLTREDCLSLTTEVVIAPLADLARTATEQDIRVIATADQGVFNPNDDRALRALLADPVCCMPERDRWHPAEGLSLTSHCLGTPGSLVSIALLLIDGIHHVDRSDHCSYRWLSTSSVYQGLREPWRGPILHGFRQVMELISLDWHAVASIDLSQDASIDIRETGLVPWFDDPAGA